MTDEKRANLLGRIEGLALAASFANQAPMAFAYNVAALVQVELTKLRGELLRDAGMRSPK